MSLGLRWTKELFRAQITPIFADTFPPSYSDRVPRVCALADDSGKRFIDVSRVLRAKLMSHILPGSSLTSSFLVSSRGEC